MWSTGYPKVGNGTCVAFKYLKLVNVPCNATSMYFNLTADGDPTTTSKPLLGYLCETRIMTTLSGTDSCTFPFTYQGKTYTSCSYDDNSVLNNNGLPWCVTDVSRIKLKVWGPESGTFLNYKLK